MVCQNTVTACRSVRSARLIWLAGASAAALCFTAAAAHAQERPAGDGQAQEQFWDGPDTTPQGNPDGSGGNGDWTTSGTNWTNAAGTANGAWQDGNIAVFAGAFGSVRLVDEHLVSGLSFRSDYTLYADSITTNGNILVAASGSLRTAGMSAIDVATNVTATLVVPIVGSGGIAKIGDGTLRLAEPNFFTGNVEINAGTAIVTGGPLALGALSNGRTVTVNGDGTILRFENGGVAKGPINYYNYASGNGGIEFGTGSDNSAPGGDIALFNYGRVTFMGNANAGGMNIFVRSGGLLDFTEDSLPSNAIITNDIGGTVQFGYLNASEASVRQLNSGGTVYLDGKRLIFGAGLPTGGGGGAITGGLQDGGPAEGSGASLVIRGDQTSVGLGGTSNYTGGTFVEGGNFTLHGTVLGDLLVTGGNFSFSSGDVAGNVVVTGASAHLLAATGSNPTNRENIDLVTLGMQTLTLSDNAHLVTYLAAPYPLGTANPLGPLDVRGNVSLSGILDVHDAGNLGFGNGLYRLITYGGALSGNGLVIGETPEEYAASNFTVQTSIAHQVNLIVNRPLAVIDRLFWDGDAAGNVGNGRIDGGNGTWNTLNTNWTSADGSSNGVMNPQPGFAIFAGAAGSVAVSNASGQVSVTGMQFATSGYTLSGDPILLSGTEPIIRVGDGTGVGAGYSTTISAPLIGAGGLVKSDLGTLVLAGNSSYTGTTRVAFGSLTVNGSIASPVTVESGAFLRGSGRVGPTQLLSGATIAPGNSIGTLTVTGNIAFAAGSADQVEVNPGAADRINATAAATLAGGTVNVFATPGAYTGATRYTILNAASGVTGTFAGATINLIYLITRLQYDANNAYLVLDLNAQFSGELHPSLGSALIDDSRFVREAALDRLRAEDGSGSGLWLRGIGTWGHWDSVGGAARVDRSLKGVLGGIDFAAGRARIGLVGGYTHTDVDLDAQLSSAKIENIHAGAYIGARWGAIGLRAGAAHSWHSATTDRLILSGAFSDAAHARYDARTLQAFGDVSARIGSDRVTVEPFGTIAYVRLKTDGFAERGGAAALTGAPATTTTAFSTLGARGELRPGGGVTLRAGAGWRHAFDDLTPSTRLTFGDGSSFDVQGVPIVTNALALDAAVNIRARDNVDLSIHYGGQLAQDATDHSVTATATLRF